MKYLKMWLCTITLLNASVPCFGQDKAKRLVCSMEDADVKEPVQLTGTGKGVKVMPFSVSGATGLFRSILPLLKNLPVVDSPSELPPMPVQTGSQNISLSCDVVSTGVKDQISKLESEVAKLRGMIEKLEGKEICPGGFVYLDRCFRLMEIRGKQFNNRKAEDLCNFNGGVLAKVDSDLLFVRASSYLAKKLLATKYENRTVIRVWLGMKYQLPPVQIPGGPFPFPVLESSTTSTSINSAPTLSSDGNRKVASSLSLHGQQPVSNEENSETPFFIPTQSVPATSTRENLKIPFSVPFHIEPTVLPGETPKTAFSLPSVGRSTLSTETNPKTQQSEPSQTHPTISTDGIVNNEFPVPSLGPPTKSSGRNHENRFLQWSPTYPTNTVTYDRIALQFRFNKAHNETISAGAVNIPRKRIGLPLCQFYLTDWDSVDSRSARLFRFTD